MPVGTFLAQNTTLCKKDIIRSRSSLGSSTDLTKIRPSHTSIDHFKSLSDYSALVILT